MIFTSPAVWTWNVLPRKLETLLLRFFPYLLVPRRQFIQCFSKKENEGVWALAAVNNHDRKSKYHCIILWRAKSTFIVACTSCKQHLAVKSVSTLTTCSWIHPMDHLATGVVLFGCKSNRLPCFFDLVDSGKWHILVLHGHLIKSFSLLSKVCFDLLFNFLKPFANYILFEVTKFTNGFQKTFLAFTGWHNVQIVFWGKWHTDIL